MRLRLVRGEPSIRECPRRGIGPALSCDPHPLPSRHVHPQPTAVRHRHVRRGCRVDRGCLARRLLAPLPRARPAGAARRAAAPALPLERGGAHPDRAARAAHVPPLPLGAHRPARLRAPRRGAVDGRGRRDRGCGLVLRARRALARGDRPVFRARHVRPGRRARGGAAGAARSPPPRRFGRGGARAGGRGCRRRRAVALRGARAGRGCRPAAPRGGAQCRGHLHRARAARVGGGGRGAHAARRLHRGGAPGAGSHAGVPAEPQRGGLRRHAGRARDREPGAGLERRREGRRRPRVLGTDRSVADFGGMPGVLGTESPEQGWNAVVKRGFDLACSGLGLLVTAPLVAVLALLVRLDSPGPVFYTQERVGMNGRRFRMIKFRSMRADAEAEGDGWTVKDDPRRTPLGSTLRRLSLDELPQLWNVFVGDMSLVGPRPEQPRFVEEFRGSIPRYMLRHHVKAGMTGWAQVNGLRGDTPLEDRIRYDLYYVQNWSLWFDVRILFLTVARVFKDANAY